MKKIKSFFKLIRAKHYIKNILIFFPLVFSKQIFSANSINVLLGFISFSLMASVVYIINDIKDVKKDRLHPVKKNRPIASGKISKSFALITAIIFYLLSLLFSYLAGGTLEIFILLMAYLILNILYTYILKNVVIIDVLLLAIFYMIRVYYGAAIIDVNVSNYLCLTIMTAALYFSLGKRRTELNKKTVTRDVLKYYSVEYLDRFMDICLSLTLVFYSLWALSLNQNYMIISILLIIVIFMKYNLTIVKTNEGDPTEVMFKDKVLIILSVIYAVLMIYLMS